MMARRNFVLKSSSNCWHSLNNDATFAEAVKQNIWYSMFFKSAVEVADINVNDIIKKEEIHEK